MRQTFRQETVRHEMAYLLQGEGGPILIFAIEADDLDLGHRVAASSPLPVDIEHHEVMDSVLAGPSTAEILYECLLEE